MPAVNIRLHVPMEMSGPVEQFFNKGLSVFFFKAGGKIKQKRLQDYNAASQWLVR